jgi:dihydrofolate reductase
MSDVPAAPSIIVAMSRNRVIGRDNRIPWHLPAELARFRRATMGHHLVMGRRTWESIGGPLPGRTSIVVSRERGLRIAGATLAHSLAGALAACGGDREPFVIGGAALIVESLPLARRLYLTVVDTEVDGDTVLPEFDLARWTAVSRERVPADARNALGFEFSVYERRG